MRTMPPPRTSAARRRVVVIDQHPLVRRGLNKLINNEPDLKVCAEADAPAAALTAIGASAPHLVITGLNFGQGARDGLALVADIHAAHPDLPVLVLTMHDANRWAPEAVAAGASGFLNKHEIDERLLMAIRTLLSGESYLNAEARHAQEDV